MTLFAARAGDTHVCALVTGIVPHVGGPILPPGFPMVLIGGQPAARLGDMVTCVGPVDAIAMGAPMVLIGNMPAARMTDMTAHGGSIMAGHPMTLIGGAAAGPGGMPVVRLPNGDLQLGNGIIISGDPGFQAQVVNRLAIMASTPSGMMVLNSINSSGRTMTIIEFKGPNSYCGPAGDNYADSTPAGRPVFNGLGNPVNNWWGTQQTGTGNGSDTVLQFNPNLTLANPSAPGSPMPNDSVMFHEMNHGAHQMNGTYDGSPQPGWTTTEERNTITGGPPSEASYNRERGYPWQRTDHDSTFAPNP